MQILVGPADSTRVFEGIRDFWLNGRQLPIQGANLHPYNPCTQITILLNRPLISRHIVGGYQNFSM